MSRYHETWHIDTNTAVYNKIPCGILQFVCPQLKVWFDLDLHESFQLLAYDSPENFSILSNIFVIGNSKIVSINSATITNLKVAQFK